VTHQSHDPRKNPSPGEKSPGLKALFSYGLGDVGFLLVWQGAALFLLYFYTDVLGLPAWQAGLIYLIAMIWDALSDPLIAAWAERRAAGGGRYSPLMAWAALPLGFSYAALFASPFQAGALAALWAMAGHLAFRTAYTFASMPYNALPIRLTRDSDARSQLAGWRVAGAALGGLVAAVLTPVAVQSASGLGETAGYLIAASLLGGLAALFLWLSASGLKEPKQDEPASPPLSYRAALTQLWAGARGNPTLLRLLAIMALGTVGFGLFTQNSLYFIEHVLQRPDLTAFALLTPALAIMVASPVWAAMATRMTKRVALILGLVLASLGYLAVGLAPGTGLAVLFIAFALVGAGTAALPVMFWSMLPDALEYGELRTGLRIEARAFGLSTFVQKAALGATALLTGGLLALSGYEPSSASAKSQAMITAMMAWLPPVFMAAIVILIWPYALTREKHAEILRALKRPDAGRP